MISKELLSNAKFSYSLHIVKVSAIVYNESRLVFQVTTVVKQSFCR